jgi:hypothetical protein
MPLTDSQRRQIGKIGIQTRLRTEDRKEMTAAARERANFGAFYDKTDPALPEAERQRQAESLRAEKMARMTLASVTARKRKARLREAGEPVRGGQAGTDSYSESYPENAK